MDRKKQLALQGPNLPMIQPDQFKTQPQVPEIDLAQKQVIDELLEEEEDEEMDEMDEEVAPSHHDDDEEVEAEDMLPATHKEAITDPDVEDVPQDELMRHIQKEGAEMMNNRGILFLDGEENFLAGVLRWLDISKVDLLKSGGSCTAFQQLMDKVKSFMNIKQFFNGNKFAHILKKPDEDILPNDLMNAWEPHLKSVPMASRRVFLRFLYCFPTLCTKHVNELTIVEGWSNIHVHPFNQRAMLNVCPGYEYQLNDDEKTEIDETFPTMVAEAATEGYPTDEMIYKNIGHIIGVPARGLSIDQNDDDNHPFPAIPSDDSQDSEYNPPAPKRNALDPRARRVLSLQSLSFGRWRAALFTPESLRHTLAVRVAQAKSAEDAKKRLEEHKQEAKQLKEAEKASKAIATAQKKEVAAAKKALAEEEKALGRRRKVNRPATALTECNGCLDDYIAPVLGALETWKTCVGCKSLYWCSKPDCAVHMENHETKCIEKQKQLEAVHQAKVAAPPRDPLPPVKAHGKKRGPCKGK